mmetsp:Transcript_31565/g.72256  ORF Transcript_31565/g.72256 Transcript_31565/m.72256 type:complete len:209 (+) Transcript_31565:200-826(+)
MLGEGAARAERRCGEWRRSSLRAAGAGEAERPRLLDAKRPRLGEAKASRRPRGAPAVPLLQPLVQAARPRLRHLLRPGQHTLAFRAQLAWRLDLGQSRAFRLQVHRRELARYRVLRFPGRPVQAVPRYVHTGATHGFAHLHRHPLRNSRVSVRHQDIAALVRARDLPIQCPHMVHAILLAWWPTVLTPNGLIAMLSNCGRRMSSSLHD